MEHLGHLQQGIQKNSKNLANSLTRPRHAFPLKYFYSHRQKYNRWHNTDIFFMTENDKYVKLRSSENFLSIF